MAGKQGKGGNRKKIGMMGAALAMLLLAGLTACAGSRQGERTDATVPVTESRAETETQPEAVIQMGETERQPESVMQTAETGKQPEEKEQPTSQENTVPPQKETAISDMQDIQKENMGGNPAREAYASVLEDLLENQKFPGGQDYGYDGFDLANNKFAVYDIDADGREELIVLYTTTYSAGMTEHIYDFDSQSGNVREQFSEYIANRYYDNGIVESDLSHNQGLAGRFWPYTVYQYDRETDSYEAIASVDAWDKSLRDTDYNGVPFPDEVDKDGDLLLYYIITAGNNTADPVDLEEYELWQNSILGGAELLDIPYMALTEENIQSIR